MLLSKEHKKFLVRAVCSNICREQHYVWTSVNIFWRIKQAASTLHRSRGKPQQRFCKLGSVWRWNKQQTQHVPLFYMSDISQEAHDKLSLSEDALNFPQYLSILRQDICSQAIPLAVWLLRVFFLSVMASYLLSKCVRYSRHEAGGLYAALRKLKLCSFRPLQPSYGHWPFPCGMAYHLL